MSVASSEIIWLRGSLSNLGFPQCNSTSLHAENTGAIRIIEIMFFMREPSILRWAAILFVMIFYLTLSDFLMFQLVSRLLIYSPKDFRDLDTDSYLTN